MIHIREDYRLFSHLPAKESVIPRSKAWMRVFPNLIEFFTEETTVKVEMSHGEVKGFTHMLNIEKERCEVFGHTELGYMHLFIEAKDGAIFLKLHRGKTLNLKLNGKEIELLKKQEVKVMESQTCHDKTREKISFGCFKKPLLEKGIDLDSKLYLLSQQMPESEGFEIECDEIKSLLSDMFAPKKEDVLHRGLNLPAVKDRFALFTTYRKKIRDALMREDKDVISLYTLKMHASGRAICLQGDGFTLDMLWKKERVQRLVIHVTEERKKKLYFGAGVKKYRVRTDLKKRGEFVSADAVLEFKPRQNLFIDRITY